MGFPELSPVGRFVSAKLTGVAELVALNFTVPETFESASADTDTVVTVPFGWMEPLASVTGITSASAFPVPSVASATMLVVLDAVPVLLIVAPDKDTPLGTVPCSDQVTLVPVSIDDIRCRWRRVRPEPPNVAGDTAVAVSDVS